MLLASTHGLTNLALAQGWQLKWSDAASCSDGKEEGTRAAFAASIAHVKATPRCKTRTENKPNKEISI